MSKFEYPPVGFRFRVNIDSMSDNDASFAEVSGISAEVTTEEITEGGENRFKHRLPLHVSYSPLVLKRGTATSNSDLIKWVYNTIEQGFAVPIIPKDLVVHLLDEENNPLLSWRFEGAYPIKYELSGLKSDANQLSIETIELSYKRFFSI
jgi:phage tail-like protein